MSEFRIDQITNQAGTAGPQVAGITTFSSTSGLLIPNGDTPYRYFYGKENIVRSGLIVSLDATNRLSYPGSGTTWTDLSGQGNNATLMNGVGYSAGNGGNLIFDGIDDYAFINVDSWIRSRSSSYTFSSFFYYDSSTNGGSPYSLLNSPNSDNGSDGFWQHLNLGPWLWRTEDTVAGELGGTVETPSVFSNGNWYYIATIVETNRLTFYRNGNLVNVTPISFSWANLRNDRSAYLYIGTGYGENYYMKGGIPNFQMYDRALTQQEILQNFNALRYRYGI